MATDHFSLYMQYQHYLAQHRPTETHAVLCALLCANPAQAAQLWMQWLSSEQPHTEAEFMREIQPLIEQTKNALSDDQYTFALLLPEDEAQQAVALAEWCQGFLLGIGLSMVKLDQQAFAFLNDMSEISQLDDQEEIDHPDTMAALVELIEYVRMGVLHLYASPELFSDFNQNS